MQDQTVPWQARKICFTNESFYLQGILKDINEQDTSFLDCKHKHMMTSGALPDESWSPKRFLRVITLWFLVLSKIFYIRYCTVLSPQIRAFPAGAADKAILLKAQQFLLTYLRIIVVVGFLANSGTMNTSASLDQI